MTSGDGHGIKKDGRRRGAEVRGDLRGGRVGGMGARTRGAANRTVGGTRTGRSGSEGPGEGLERSMEEEELTAREAQ